MHNNYDIVPLEERCEVEVPRSYDEKLFISDGPDDPIGYVLSPQWGYQPWETSLYRSKHTTVGDVVGANTCHSDTSLVC